MMVGLIRERVVLGWVKEELVGLVEEVVVGESWIDKEEVLESSCSVTSF